MQTRLRERLRYLCKPGIFENLLQFYGVFMVHVFCFFPAQGLPTGGNKIIVNLFADPSSGGMQRNY